MLAIGPRKFYGRKKVRLDAAEAVLTAIDAGSDVEASDDEDATAPDDAMRELPDESSQSDEDSDSDDDVPLARTRKQGSTEMKGTKVGVPPVKWSKCKEFKSVPAVHRSSDLADDIEERSEWTKVDYFEQYFGDDMYDILSKCTNMRSVKETGKSINCTSAEMKLFFGIVLLSGSLNFPQIRMYWAGITRVPRIANAMGRDRFFKIRSNLKVVDDDFVTDDDKKADRLWKVRPVLERFRSACLKLHREGEVSIDEQMIPFSGTTSLKQYVPNKPNPVGLKSFVLANPDGLVLDFRIYSGKDTFSDVKCTNDKIGLGGRAVVALTDTLLPGTIIYCDRYFTSLPLLTELLGKNLLCTGTIQKNRIGVPGKKLTTDKEFMKKSRGSHEVVQTSDRKMCVVKWLDNKPILMASTNTSIQPEGLVRRWSKKERKYINVKCPAVVMKYNCKMGGVDMSDRMISYYRTRTRTRKWTIRTVFHFFDLAVTNSWIQYRNDRKHLGDRPKEILQLLAFKTQIAEYLLSSTEPLDEPEGDDNNHGEPSHKRPCRTPVPSTYRRSAGHHWPQINSEKTFSSRCRNAGCSSRSKVKCLQCDVHLCLTAGRNCFVAFHLDQAK